MFNFKKINFVIIGLLLFKSLVSQVNIDSLGKRSEELPDDTASVNKIIRFGNSQKKVNLATAIAIYKIAYNKAKQTKNNYTISLCALCLGSTYSLLSDFENASLFITEAQKLAESIDNKELLLKIHLTTGNLYSFNGQLEKAREIYEQALILCDEIKDNVSKATIYNNIGGLIYKESKYEKKKIIAAISYFKCAIELLEKTGSKEDIANKYCNMALMYTDIGMNDSALYFLNKAKIIIDKKKLPDDLITYYNYCGRVYTDLKDFDKAEQNYLLSLEECKKLNNIEWVGEAYIGLADMYEAKKEFDNAYRYFLKYHYLQDSLVNITNFSKVADIQNRFEREKKEVELSKLKSERAKNRIFNIALILVSLLLVVSGIMMYSRFKIKSESEKKLKAQNEIIGQKNKDITDSINYSRKIQDAILPSQKSLSEIFPEHFILYKPKDIISGDFYWSAVVGPLKFFAVADCTGHGVPGALMSMLGTSLLNEIVLTKNITKVNDILNELRQHVINALDQSSGNKDGMDIALICYDEKNSKLYFSGANNSLIIIRNKTLTEIKPNKQPIGIYDKLEDFTSHVVEITGDTIICLYTDGYADQFGGPKGKKLKYKQLNDLLLEISDKQLSEQKEILNNRFEEWKKDLEQVDDVCVAGLKINQHH